MTCVTCGKPIIGGFRKHEFTTSEQGTRRNFRHYWKFWHESCWLAEESAEAERRKVNDVEFQRELTEARKAIANG